MVQAHAPDALPPPPPQSRGALEDSLARSLLCVPCLQQSVATVLLGRLAEAAAEEGSDLPASLLSQFRWLDHLSNAEQLINLLLEVMAACPLALQKGKHAFTFCTAIRPPRQLTRRARRNNLLPA